MRVIHRHQLSSFSASRQPTSPPVHAGGRLQRQEHRNIVHNEYSFGGDRLSATSRETHRPRGDAVRMRKSMHSNEHGQSAGWGGGCAGDVTPLNAPSGDWRRMSIMPTAFVVAVIALLFTRDHCSYTSSVSPNTEFWHFVHNEPSTDCTSPPQRRLMLFLRMFSLPRVKSFELFVVVQWRTPHATIYQSKLQLSTFFTK